MSHQCICGLSGELKFPLTSQYFCPSCFSLKFEKRLLKRTPRYVRGHAIAIALSGGKDSATLLHILHKYHRKLRITMLAAIILEEEIPEIQSSREKVIDQLKSKYSDIRFIKKSYSDLFGYSLPSLVQKSDKQGLGFTPCAICGVLRRHGILRMSLDIGADFIAIGNTLEDEAGTTLLNILRGNPWKNFRDQIEYKTIDGKSLPLRFKPLTKASEGTISTYSTINHLSVLNTQCTFADRSLRSEIATFLTAMEKKDQNILYNIVSSMNKGVIMKTQVKKVHKCKKCASYSPEPECSACRIVRQIMS